MGGAPARPGGDLRPVAEPKKSEGNRIADILEWADRSGHSDEAEGVKRAIDEGDKARASAEATRLEQVKEREENAEFEAAHRALLREEQAKEAAARPKIVVRLPSERERQAKPGLSERERSELMARSQARQAETSREHDRAWASEWIRAFEQSGAQYQYQSREMQERLKRAYAILGRQVPYRS